jgi:hypothetical protein
MSPRILSLKASGLHLVAVQLLRGMFRQSSRETRAAHFSKAELLSMQPTTSEWPKFCDDFCKFRAHAAAGTRCSGERWMEMMKNDGTGTFGIIVGGVVAAIAVVFILTGGELGGKKTVEGDQDLPPVTSTDK